MTNITQAEILDAIRDAVQTADVPDAFTMRELQDATGWGEKQARAKMRVAKLAGRVDVVRVERENLQGRMMPVLAYRLVAPKKAKRGR